LRAPSLDAHLALDILRTHPIAVMGEALRESPSSPMPEDFLGERKARGSTPRVHKGVTGVSD
jgi:hypothetical protein